MKTPSSIWNYRQKSLRENQFCIPVYFLCYNSKIPLFKLALSGYSLHEEIDHCMAFASSSPCIVCCEMEKTKKL